MDNKGSIVIATFGGLGKTTFARKYPDIAIDLEGITYKYIYHSRRSRQMIRAGIHEPLKGLDSDRSLNPMYPANYVGDIIANLGKYRYILIVLSPEVLKELERKHIGYYLICPAGDAKKTILKRLHERGNTSTFINKIDKILSSTEIAVLQKTLQPIAFYRLPKDSYLEEFIYTTFCAPAATRSDM